MSVVWHRGVPWYDKALASAQRRGSELVDVVETIAESYRLGVGSFAVGPEVDPQSGVAYDNRVRVAARGHSAVISQPGGVVIGFSLPATEDHVRNRVVEASRD